MKKLFKILVVILVLLAMISTFCACAGKEGEFKIVVIRANSTSEYVLDNTGEGMTYLVDAFDSLQSDTESGFSYALVGGFLNTVNGYTADASNNEFWAIYTDCEIDGLKYYDNSWGTAEYDGVIYGSGLKGVSELPLNGGSTYIIKLSTW